MRREVSTYSSLIFNFTFFLFIHGPKSFCNPLEVNDRLNFNFYLRRFQNKRSKKCSHGLISVVVNVEFWMREGRGLSGRFTV